MIEIFPAAARHSADLGWLQSRPVFSFGSYQNSDREGFGVMRVCNDDILAPDTGFGAHPHSDMEIVTIVLNGRIRHEDNLGHRAVASFGEVQRMTAGSGIIHTEFNDSDTEQLRLLQLWFMPRERGLLPSYETSRYEPDGLANALLPVVSGKSLPGSATIAQDLTIYLGKLEPGRSLTYESEPGRKHFLYMISGRLAVLPSEGNRTSIAESEVLQAQSQRRLELTAEANAFFMLIDL
ncbi:pirin family protein [Paenibacillus hemerocallicola]|uniref:Pirin family protein n=1 Tax=Paenibacillus hemerocallicola TaxID=1172614 RepID=A0A5C4TF97_9BACL|nr:pirin-like bicupin family protein [Paenibacillus hemerocallicola]TNJ67711.1 pirin family protein [Paenibacillus hemerocallicola]